MKIKDLDLAVNEAERFIKAAKDARQHAGETQYSAGGSHDNHYTIGRYAAAAKRASLDLTKALSRLRSREN